MTRSIDRLPASLRRYCSEHDPSKYTARDHAAWRYIMRRSQDFFREHAVSTYQDGFRKSGLRIDRIPLIDDIDRSLQEFGWGAVPVVGFIPTWAFIEFQARKILPIATDMRSVEHIAYTPAPDIVHEAAGHAPILPDLAYSDYLSYYATLGTKALYSHQDLRMYEAVRYLSDIKEKPESTAAIIADAEAKLKEAQKAYTFVSEQALVARMSWWTAEYGLAGDIKKPKIYGAGLLSSVGESKLAMTEKVKKIPFSLDCINYSYNITEPQPQLFVAENMQHLHDVLHQLDAKLAYRVGGVASLHQAIACQAISSTVFDSGLTVSGRLVTAEHQGDRIDFLRYEGPVQICEDRQQLAGHGLERHGQGFSTPLGRLEGFTHKAFSDLSTSELESLNLVEGRTAHLRFASGFEVQGRVLSLYRPKQKLLLLSFGECTVRKGSRITFDPSWGEFDMIVADSVPSVYGGPADREAFGEQELAEASSSPARETPFTSREKQVFGFYQTLADLRQASQTSAQKIEAFATTLEAENSDEWLLWLDILELVKTRLSPEQQAAAWVTRIQARLDRTLLSGSSDTRELIQEGLRLIP